VNGMPWPTPQDYNETVQNPAQCFADEQLRSASAEVNLLGLPKARTGSFASVYKFSDGRKNWAVRCFLRETHDSARYEKLSAFLTNCDLPHLVPFVYLQNGIKLNGVWYPMLKMEWADGETLDNYVRKNRTNTALIAQLGDKFAEMTKELKDLGMAHGDLQHGNIIVSAQNQLQLVDYDGLFVPPLAGMQSHELGHPNYQHPGRDARHFHKDLDNFSNWVIAASLGILAIDPSIGSEGHLSCGDDALLFRRSDFARPQQSPAFYALEKHESAEVVAWSRWVRSFASGSIDAVADVHDKDALPVPTGLPPVEPLPVLGAMDSEVSWSELRKYYDLDRDDLNRASTTKDINTEPVLLELFDPTGSGPQLPATRRAPFSLYGFKKLDAILFKNLTSNAGTSMLFPFWLYIGFLGKHRDMLWFAVLAILTGLFITYYRTDKACRRLAVALRTTNPKWATLKVSAKSDSLSVQVMSGQSSSATMPTMWKSASLLPKIYPVIFSDHKQFEHLRSRTIQCITYFDESEAPVAIIDNGQLLPLI
jgi:predicted Ser/Thr protein kinase